MAVSCSLIKYRLRKAGTSVIAEATDAARDFLAGDLSAGYPFGDKSKEFTIGLIHVHKDYRRCGIGTKLYEMVAQGACDLGARLTSDQYRSEASEGFWAKQVKKGRARCIKSADPDWVSTTDPTFTAPRYGRGNCDRYELIGCPISSLAGNKKSKKKRSANK